MIAQIELIQLSIASPPLEALLAPDGIKGAGVKSLCRFVNIVHQAQIKRIRRQPDLAAALHVVTISTTTGPKEALMLESHAIAIWAAGLQTSRFSPDKQERVIILKRDAYAAIERAFGQQNAAARTESAVQHPLQEPGAARSPFDKILEGIAELQEEHATLQQRITLLEQVSLGSRKRDGASLTAEQLGQVIMQLRLLRDRRGIPIEEAEKLLAAEFGVAHLSDIDSARWTDIVHKIHQLFQQGNK